MEDTKGARKRLKSSRNVLVRETNIKYHIEKWRKVILKSVEKLCADIYIYIYIWQLPP